MGAGWLMGLPPFGFWPREPFALCWRAGHAGQVLHLHRNAWSLTILSLSFPICQSRDSKADSESIFHSLFSTHIFSSSFSFSPLPLKKRKHPFFASLFSTIHHTKSTHSSICYETSGSPVLDTMEISWEVRGQPWPPSTHSLPGQRGLEHETIRRYQWKWKQWQILFSWAPKSLWTVTEATKLKDASFLEEKQWQT